MKTLFVLMGLSIMSAIVAVFAVTELCPKPNSGAASSDGIRATSADARPPHTRQRVRQWVNH